VHKVERPFTVLDRSGQVLVVADVTQNKTDSSEETPSEEISSDEDSFQKRPSKDHASKIKPSVNFKKSQALPKCHLAWDPNDSVIRIALRLSHKYLGDRHIISQVVSEQPRRNEPRKDTRHRMDLRPGKRHRVALYLGGLDNKGHRHAANHDPT
jgi:hypothetical protein